MVMTMKNNFFYFLFLTLILLASDLCAEEMIIKLKSGNILKIQFTGQIQGVEMISGNDSIENFKVTLSDTQSKIGNTKSDMVQHVKTDCPCPKKNDCPTENNTKKIDTSPKEDTKVKFRMAPPKFGDE